MTSLSQDQVPRPKSYGKYPGLWTSPLVLSPPLNVPTCWKITLILGKICKCSKLSCCSMSSLTLPSYFRLLTHSCAPSPGTSPDAQYLLSWTTLIYLNQTHLPTSSKQNVSWGNEWLTIGQENECPCVNQLPCSSKKCPKQHSPGWPALSTESLWKPFIFNSHIEFYFQVTVQSYLSQYENRRLKYST